MDNYQDFSSIADCLDEIKRTPFVRRVIDQKIVNVADLTQLKSCATATLCFGFDADCILSLTQRPEVHICSLVILLYDGKVLLVYDTKPQRYWTFPAGHIERGESAVVAAQRELLEESGLCIDLSGSYVVPCWCSTSERLYYNYVFVRFLTKRDLPEQYSSSFAAGSDQEHQLNYAEYVHRWINLREPVKLKVNNVQFSMLRTALPQFIDFKQKKSLVAQRKKKKEEDKQSTSVTNTLK